MLRGSYSAAQAILNARALAVRLAAAGHDHEKVLQAYDDERREATARVVLTNRANPPDAIRREVYERTGDTPSGRIEDVISRAEIVAMMDGYRAVAGVSLSPSDTVSHNGRPGSRTEPMSRARPAQ